MLKLNNVSKTFNPGTVNEKTALSGLTLDVHDGDFITIIGANGAGKSTLFNAIAGSFLHRLRQASSLPGAILPSCPSTSAHA